MTVSGLKIKFFRNYFILKIYSRKHFSDLQTILIEAHICEMGSEFHGIQVFAH